MLGLMQETQPPPCRAAHRLYVHVVWPTLGRLPLIPRNLKGPTEAQLIALSRRLDAEPVCIRVLTDRAHLLLRLKPTHSVAGLVEHLKNGSEEALNRAGRSVRWARGYAATTLNGDEVRRAMRHIVSLPDGRAGRASLSRR